MYYNKTKAASKYVLYPFISVLLIFSFLMASCQDDDDPEQDPPIPDYTIIVKDIQNIPDNFVFDRVEVEVTGADWSVIETLKFPYENGQIVMNLYCFSFGTVTESRPQRGDGWTLDRHFNRRGCSCGYLGRFLCF